MMLGRWQLSVQIKATWRSKLQLKPSQANAFFGEKKLAIDMATPGEYMYNYN